MADYVAKLGLDSSEHDRKLKQVERDAARSGQQIARNLQSGMNLARGVVGHNLLEKTFKSVGRSVAEFAKENSDAQRVVAQWEGLASRVSNTFGREYANLMEGLGGFADSAVGLFESGFEKITNAAADVMKLIAGTYGPGESAADVVAARQGREELDRHIRSVQQLRKEYAELQASQADAMGDTEGGARIRAKLKRDLALIAIAAGKDDPNVKAQRRDIVGGQFELDTEAIDSKAFDAQSKVLLDGLKLQRQLEGDVRKFTTQGRIDRLAASGSRETAALAGQAAEYQAKLEQIRKSYSIDDSARSALEREFVTQGRLSLLAEGNAAVSRLRSELTKAESPRSYRTIEAGLGNVAPNVYGGGSSRNNEVDRIRMDIEKLLNVLQEIRNNTRDLSPYAVLG